MQLDTDRLTLRPFEPDDWVAVHRYASDLAVVEFMDWGPNSEAETKLFISRARFAQAEQPQSVFELAVIETAMHELIGAAGIHVSSPSNREGWIGYCLRRESWGQGFATELARRLIRFGFNDLKLHRIFATCDPRNVRSRRVLEKIGMIPEGHMRENKWVRGRWRDSFVYAVLERTGK
jgi:RimJ/RimL family protein N-acetyltransferase